MQREVIEIVIKKDGTMKVESSGFSGPVCSKEIAKFIAGKVIDDTKKPEFYETSEEAQVKLSL